MKRRFLVSRDRVGEMCSRMKRGRAGSCPVLFLCLALCALAVSGCSGTGGNAPETEPVSKETQSEPVQETSTETETEPQEPEPRFGSGEMWSREYDLAAFLEMYSAEIPQEVIPEKTVTLKIASVDYVNAKKDTVLTGSFADVLKEKFNVEIELVDVTDPSADLYLFDPSMPEFSEAVKEGRLVDLEDSGLLENYGAYLTFSDAASLNHVRAMTEAYTASRENTKEKDSGAKDEAKEKDSADDASPLYGVGTMVGYRNESFSCGHNLPSIRFDVYQESGSPNIATLEDLPDILALMVMTCPRDDKGGKTYGVTYSREWDGDLPYLLRTTANLYGYEDWGLGFYNVETRTFEPLLKENGIGIRMLRFYNELYRRGLIDPDSETQTMDEARAKIAQGTAMWDPDPTEYNTKKHLSEGQAMLFLPADDFVISDQSIAPWDPERILSIGAKTKYRELCMSIINWLATPEGCMSEYYGKQGENWDYDETGVPYLTEKGQKLFGEDEDKSEEKSSDKKTDKSEEKSSDKKTDKKESAESEKKDSSNEKTDNGAEALRYMYLWAPDAMNPVTSGFTYRAEDWPSEVLGSRTKIEEEWSKYTGYASAGDLLVQEEMLALTATTGMTAFPAVPGPLNPSWRDCVDCILEDCHDAIYSKTEKEFNKKIEELRKHLQESGYADCEQYCYDAAALRRSSENALDRMLIWEEEETETP